MVNHVTNKIFLGITTTREKTKKEPNGQEEKKNEERKQNECNSRTCNYCCSRSPCDSRDMQLSD